jgi:predicted  nucleic acid-binding Zn-ribbon protein
MANSLMLCLECGNEFELNLSDVTVEHECPECGSVDLDVMYDDVAHAEEHDQFNSDAEADADVLASAGWGTDEDYGYYGDDSF